MIGARAADLIAEAVTAMEFRASAEDIFRMFMHILLYGEAIKEAIRRYRKTTIHIIFD